MFVQLWDLLFIAYLGHRSPLVVITVMWLSRSSSRREMSLGSLGGMLRDGSNKCCSREVLCDYKETDHLSFISGAYGCSSDDNFV